MKRYVRALDEWQRISRPVRADPSQGTPFLLDLLEWCTRELAVERGPIAPSSAADADAYEALVRQLREQIRGLFEGAVVTAAAEPAIQSLLGAGLELVQPLERLAAAPDHDAPIH